MPGTLNAVLHDTLLGRPAAGLRMQIYWSEPSGDVLLRAASTNDHGTTATPLLTGSKLSAGTYKLVLHVGDYFQNAHADRPRCFELLPIVFIVDDAGASRTVTVDVSPDGYAVRCV